MVSQTGSAVGHFLREAYPGRGKAKRLARDFDVSVSTAKLLLAGSAAGAWIDRLAARFGWAFLEAVYRPEGGARDRVGWDAATDGDLGRLEARIARLESLAGGDEAGP